MDIWLSKQAFSLEDFQFLGHSKDLVSTVVESLSMNG